MRTQISQRMQTGRALIRLGRFPFLGGGIILHCLGIGMALYDGSSLNIRAVVWGQLAISATQLMTHYANDYFDLQADRANRTPTNWSGGSRVLVENRLPPTIALWIALGLAAIAFGSIVVLSVWVRPGFGTLALLLTAQGLAWFYSAPPIRLHSRGLGELTTAIIVTLLTPLTGYYLQSGVITLLPLLAVLPLCCLQFAMLLAIEVPDAEGDRLVHKRTLVVRLGSRRAAQLYGVLLLLAYALLPLLVGATLPLAVAVAIVAIFPLAASLLWRVYRGHWQQPAHWNALGFYTIALLIGTATAELAAFMLLIGTM
ncbi:MAG: prenyltransferase [Armatimonadetes bacterium]|nr:prenyltransferase [Anaerolineae bacterium]